MAEYKLKLEKREIVGKKSAELRKDGMVTSVVYGGKEPIMTASDYVATQKVLERAGYHSPIDLEIDGKKKLAIVKNVQVNPVSRQILNVEFQAISAKEAVTATTPVKIVNFEASEASKTYHYSMNQSVEEIEVKAKPADLPNDLEIDASKMESLEDKLTVGDIKLPAGVEFADKELGREMVVASLFDPAAEAEKREAESEEEAPEAADVPSENGEKPAEEGTEEA